MDPLTMGMMALSAGSGVANYFNKKGKKASVNLNLPTYQASQYDAPAAAQLFSTLQDRVAGKNVGYSPEDMATMNAQAVDQSAQAGNEFLNRSMAGRQNTGGVSTGGTNVVRDKALMYAGGLKSNALRDVAIKNAVQKRQEINAAIPQEQTFLGAERDQANTLYNQKMQQTMLQKEEADKVEAFNQARTDSANQGLYDMIGGVTSGFSGNTNPYAFGYEGGGVNSGFGGDQGMMSLGQLLSQFKPKTNKYANEGVMG